MGAPRYGSPRHGFSVCRILNLGSILHDADADLGACGKQLSGCCLPVICWTITSFIIHYLGWQAEMRSRSGHMTGMIGFDNGVFKFQRAFNELFSTRCRYSLQAADLKPCFATGPSEVKSK